MNFEHITVRSDLENVCPPSSDKYENDLQQELDELLAQSESEDDTESLDDTENEDTETEDNAVTEKKDDANVSSLKSNLQSRSNQSYVNFVDVNTNPDSEFPANQILKLTQEEAGVITNCTDPELKQLLILNRRKVSRIKEAIRELVHVYEECTTKIQEERTKQREKLRQDKEDTELKSMAKTYIWRIGIPYFKDKGFYRAPPNKDLQIKKENKEFLLMRAIEGRRWTNEDQAALHQAITQDYVKFREMQYEKNIRILGHQIKNETDVTKKEVMTAQLENLESNLNTVLFNIKSEVPPINCDEGINWLKIANHNLKGKHTVLECKAFWRIYLHPSINKSDWHQEENERLKELVEKYKYQDWTTIANELNTNRSDFLLCVHYSTKLCDKFKRQRFLPEEDEFLREVVDNCRLGDYIPWGRVAYYFEDRSKHQLYHRYKYYLSCKHVIKGTFSEAEDILLTHLVQRFGKDFSRISEFMPQRTTIQLRNRYSTYLEKVTINLGNFTCADDEKILEHVKKNGDKTWSVLAEEMNRTRAHVRQRYLTLKKCLERDPDLKIEKVPRRRQNFLATSQNGRNKRLNEGLEKLKELKGIPTLATVKSVVDCDQRDINEQKNKWRVLRVYPKRAPSVVDKKLINFFKGVSSFQRTAKAPAETSLKNSARRIIKLFECLGGNVKLLAKADSNNKAVLTEKEKKDCIFEYIQEVLREGSVKLDPVTEPSTSEEDPLLIDLSKQPKYLIPPTVSTIVGLRGLIVKYQVLKFQSKHPSDGETSTSTAVPTELLPWRVEQNFLNCDSFTMAVMKHQQDIFLKRFYALFKWPSILSKRFPEQLTCNQEEELEEEEEENEAEEEIIEEQQPLRTGRPPKRVYAKVLKMVETRKKNCGISEDVGEEEGIVKMRRKRGPKTYKPKNVYAVPYYPRRAYVKKPKKVESEASGVSIKCEPSTSQSGNEQDTSTSSYGISTRSASRSLMIINNSGASTSSLGTEGALWDAQGASTSSSGSQDPSNSFSDTQGASTSKKLKVISVSNSTASSSTKISSVSNTQPDQPKVISLSDALSSLSKNNKTLLNVSKVSDVQKIINISDVLNSAASKAQTTSTASTTSPKINITYPPSKQKILKLPSNVTLASKELMKQSQFKNVKRVIVLKGGAAKGRVNVASNVVSDKNVLKTLRKATPEEIANLKHLQAKQSLNMKRAHNDQAEARKKLCVKQENNVLVKVETFGDSSLHPDQTETEDVTIHKSLNVEAQNYGVIEKIKTEVDLDIVKHPLEPVAANDALEKEKTDFKHSVFIEMNLSNQLENLVEEIAEENESEESEDDVFEEYSENDLEDSDTENEEDVWVENPSKKKKTMSLNTTINKIRERIKREQNTLK